MKDIVHRITMTDDHTLRLITNLATKDYTVNDLNELEKQLDNHKYEEDNLVLEPNDQYNWGYTASIILYLMKKGYSIDNVNKVILKKRSVK